MLHAGHATEIWSRWGGDPGAAATLVGIAATYAAGTRMLWLHAGRGRGIRVWRAQCFAAGIVVLAIALLSPLEALADALFSAHMAQHVLLAVVAPPLLVAGAPVVAAMWALPAGPRRRFALRVREQRQLVAVWRAITNPLVAGVLHAVALWSWHAPVLYQAALANSFVHFLEHASFVGTASLVWWSILHPRQNRQAGYAVGLAVLFLTALHSSILGALLTLSTHPWFPVQSAQSTAWGFTPLEDQQLAGLIMWVPGGLLYAVAMAALFMAGMGRFGSVASILSRPDVYATRRSPRPPG